MATKANDKTYMAQALELARKGRGKTSPNPMVGAVIVRGKTVVGRGYHRKAGSAHAERMALRQAGAKARGATLYVTLEPCCHTGNTGPCCEAIIEAGIKRVVYAVKDPDPRVSGRGARTLKRAGIKVTSGVLRSEASRLNESFFAFHSEKRPFVVLKLAQTLDGCIATHNGDSKWITAKPARKFAHQLRAESDGIIVGAGTVRTDNPALTVRHVRGRNPYRIVLSTELKLPRQLHLFADNTDQKTILVSTDQAIDTFSRRRRKNGLTFWSVKKSRNGQLLVPDILRRAADFGLQSLLVEGGARVATSFIRSGLVDKYVIITAPKIVGDGRRAIGDLNIRNIADAVSLKDVSAEQVGDDIVITAYPDRGKK